MSEARKVLVDTYTTWQQEPRITLSIPGGQTHNLTMAEAERLAADLDAAMDDIRDDVEREVDEMFADEPECRAGTHGPRNSSCTCEDSGDE